MTKTDSNLGLRKTQNGDGVASAGQRESTYQSPASCGAQKELQPTATHQLTRGLCADYARTMRGHEFETAVGRERIFDTLQRPAYLPHATAIAPARVAISFLLLLRLEGQE